MEKKAPKKSKKIYGIGINDSPTQVTINGKKCPFYKKWQNMIQRCYDEKFQSRYPSYIGCTVCESWLYFSNFKEWMIQQDWEGKHLDKDILQPGNRIYSPETCIFVEQSVNKFLANLYFNARLERGYYRVTSCNSEMKQIELGKFNSIEDSYEAWKRHKICLLKNMRLEEKLETALEKALLSFKKR